MSEPIPLPTNITPNQLTAACEALGIDPDHVRRFDLVKVEVETWEVRVVRYTTWPPSLIPGTDDVDVTVDTIPVGALVKPDGDA